MLDAIKQYVESSTDQLYDLRHYFHQHAELGLQEFETSDKICEFLDHEQIPYRRGVGGTGVAAVIEGAKPGKTLLIRADMDALAITEKTGLPYSSLHEGVMHACGHDGHTAQALMAAKFLHSVRDQMHGSVKMVFQPAEENGGGAPGMIEDNVLENPHVDAGIACHLWGSCTAGTVMLKPGPMMAGTYTFSATLVGKGGHGAYPQSCVDPVVMAADFIMQVQTILSRRISPMDPAVITCGYVSGANQHNVIPNEVEVRGSVRYLSDQVKETLKSETEKIIKGVAASYGGSYRLKTIFHEFPALINDAGMTKIAEECLRDVVGAGNVVHMDNPSLGSEDYAFFSQKIPSVYFFVGISEDPENPIAHHSETFDFSDKYMKTALISLLWIAWSYLNK